MTTTHSLMNLSANHLAENLWRRHTYKHRMAIASKGKGKSGGARVITYNVKQTADDEVVITLMTIYDKSDISNVSDAYIRSLVQSIEKK